MTRVVFRAAAAADVESAHRWYEEQRPGLGDAFLAEVQECARRIEENPRLYALRDRKVRRAPLQRFPHALLYREHLSGIFVVACFHAKQSPAGLRERR